MDWNCWHRTIDQAASEAEVVAQARDYLVLWSPQELGALANPGLRLETGSDLVRVKRQLDRGLLLAPSEAPSAELAGYFWHAAARVNQLRKTLN